MTSSINLTSEELVTKPRAFVVSTAQMKSQTSFGKTNLRTGGSETDQNSQAMVSPLSINK